MPTHGGNLQDVFVRQMGGSAFERQRIAHAVATSARLVTALLGAVDRGGPIHAQTEVGFLYAFQEILSRHAVVEHGGRGGRGIQAVDHRMKIRLDVPIPVG